MRKLIFTVLGGAGLLLVIAGVHHTGSSAVPPGPVAYVQEGSKSVAQTEDEETPSGEAISLGTLLGVNKPAPPPIVFYMGRPPGEADAPDLSTPAAAVHSVLSLIDEGVTDTLAPCFVSQTEDTVSELYPAYLGHPIELVEVLEEGENAEVVWKATVHTMFSRDGTSRTPGDTVTLRTKLIRVEDIWKLSQLHD